MEILILFLLLLAAFIIIGPFILPFFLPNIKGFDGCLSIIIGIILVLCLGWWGILAYLLIVYISKNYKDQY